MDTQAIFWAIVTGAIGGLVAWLITVVAGEMITRPKLIVSDNWMRRKRVYKLEKEKHVPYTFTDPKLGITVSTTSASSSSDEGITEGWEISGGGYFDFYGITIKNFQDSYLWMHRRTAEIKETKLFLDDGQEIECRWWSRDFSESDKLFPTNEIPLGDRRNVQIAAGGSYYLVIAYRNSEGSDYFLFDIVSDIGENFWSNKNPILDFPKYGTLKIVTNSASFEKKLELHLSDDAKNDLKIIEIPKFPNGVFVKETR
jgi:hypothetical protein